MTTQIQLTAAEVTRKLHVLKVVYTFTGDFPEHGPVAFTTTVHPVGDRSRARRFGIKWVDGQFSSKYVFDEQQKPINKTSTDVTPAAYTLPTNGELLVEYLDEVLDGYGAELEWQSVITVDHPALDLEPVLTGRI